MGMVTVDDAAHRLGLSVATVRRYMASGRLLGAKVGRDWHVDEAGLPPIGSTGAARPAQSASPTTNWPPLSNICRTSTCLTSGYRTCCVGMIS